MSKNALTQRGITRRRNAARRHARLRETPLGRLVADGAAKDDQTRKRLQWLAQEWQLPPVPRVGPYMTSELLDFMKKYGISCDWLLYGSLNGLQQMMRARRMQGRVPSVEQIKKKYDALSPEDQRMIDAEVQRILDEGTTIDDAP